MLYHSTVLTWAVEEPIATTSAVLVWSINSGPWLQDECILVSPFGHKLVPFLHSCFFQAAACLDFESTKLFKKLPQKKLFDRLPWMRKKANFSSLRVKPLEYLKGREGSLFWLFQNLPTGWIFIELVNWNQLIIVCLGLVKAFLRPSWAILAKNTTGLNLIWVVGLLSGFTVIFQIENYSFSKPRDATKPVKLYHEYISSIRHQ